MEVKAEVPPPPPPQPQRITANNMKQQQAGKIANAGLNGVANQNQVKPEPAINDGNQSFGNQNDDRKPFNQNQGGNRQNFGGRGGRGMGNRFGGGGRGGPGGGGNRNFQQNRNQNQSQNQDVSNFVLGKHFHFYKMATSKRAKYIFCFITRYCVNEH